MKKSDLKAGTVYAFKKDSYNEAQPVLLVTEQLLKIKGERDTETKEWTVKLFAAPQGAVPGRGYYGDSVGYLCLVPQNKEGREHLAEADYEAMLKECHAQGKVVQPKTEDYRLELRNNRFLTGVWESVDAAQQAKRARVDANNAKGREWEKAAQERYFAARKVIAQALGEQVYGGVPEYVPAYYGNRSGIEEGIYRSKGSITLSIEEMEKLAALLSEK